MTVLGPIGSTSHQFGRTVCQQYETAKPSSLDALSKPSEPDQVKAR